ncbi:PepSY-associated TM helix domain-containing protein [Shewanella sp. AS16]|uniref:PepSY-associated TM helix domain-containing protein n=1 Tax=Shewanella sp. AS16 TaxID=2907625 RepID=UPI001F38DE9E|nr:PepSY-associated TM helix domain-containing protein [Shewanella sp. AS16]MCE9685728.1 PepSY-associated TM helix domain-containing protein [Shewanella sp. AS16]
MIRKHLDATHRASRQKSLRIRILRQLRPWHRRLGIVSVLFVLLLTLTGVAINHSQDFNLAQKQVHQGWLLDYYGIQVPNHVAQFGTGAAPLLITDKRLWRGKTLLLEAQTRLISAARFGELILAIDANQLYLFDNQGRLLETQNASTGLPQELQALAVIGEQQVWLRTPKGYYQSDDQLIDWVQAMPLAPIAWATPLTAASPELIQNARGANLNWERVLLDLHSGRLLGATSVWIWDLFALALLLVSLSGFWIWYKQKPAKH